MRIPLDRESPTPLYAQVAGFLGERCRSGALPPGTRLPSARRLAEELGLSRVTAEAAYAELEAEAVVERRQGSGTYVAAAPGIRGAQREVAAPTWLEAALRERSAPGIEAGAGLGGAGGEGLIDLSSGLADPELFPAADFRKALRRVAADPLEEILGYGDPRGYAPFREAVARVLASRGIDAGAEEVLVTSGSQEALTLTALLLRRPGARVLVESPTYAAALGLFRSLGFAPRGLPSDEGGISLAGLEAALEDGGAAFLYLMPNFRNPTGTTMEAGRRRAVVELAERHGLPVLEDDYVGDLRYEGRELPALAAFGRPGSVLYAGTFSKMLAPGLRVGFLVARGAAYRPLLELKYCASLAASNLAQRALHAVLSVGSYENHLRRSRRAYRARRDLLLAALRQAVPALRLCIPAGGLFAWAELPEGFSAEALGRAAAKEGLLLYPGRPCFPDPEDSRADRCLRLNFAAQSELRLQEGVERLARAARNLGLR